MLTPFLLFFCRINQGTHTNVCMCVYLCLHLLVRPGRAVTEEKNKNKKQK